MHDEKYIGIRPRDKLDWVGFNQTIFSKCAGNVKSNSLRQINYITNLDAWRIEAVQLGSVPDNTSNNKINLL